MPHIMNDRPDERQADDRDGLCGACRQAHVIRNDRGSRFLRCLRSETDPGFARYPLLPVLSCRGYDPVR
jgi:hypothetical protein